VTQADIGSTICRDGWTATIRPPESYTESLKYRQLTAYGEPGPVGGYEEDHLIPLELGGSPASPRNLWPEPGASPNPKDGVEAAANQAVCDGRMTLAVAQAAIATNWIALGQRVGVVQKTQPAVTATPNSPAPSCVLSASYNASYQDYDIYVHSNQPDVNVKVTASSGTSATWHTDNTGYADVYLRAPGSAPGQRVIATVGPASCSTTLS
jgi:hypothetical protein